MRSKLVDGWFDCWGNKTDWEKHPFGSPTTKGRCEYSNYSAGIYLFIVDYGNTKTIWKTCWKLIIKIPE